MAEEKVIIGQEKLLQVFENLRRAEQRKVVKIALAKALKPLEAGIRSNWDSNYRTTPGSFSDIKIKIGKRRTLAAVGILDKKTGVKLSWSKKKQKIYEKDRFAPPIPRFLNYGTADRYTDGKGASKRYRGKIKASHFFNAAYATNADTTIERASALLVEALNQIANPQPTE